MRLLLEFTKGQINASKKQCAAILIAIWIASMFLASIMGIFETAYRKNLAKQIEANGEWHVRVSNVEADRIVKLKNHPDVQTLFYSTLEVLSGKIEGLDKPYLATQRYSKDYFKYMPIKNKLIEGRFPANDKEIALSKQLKDTYKIGETLVVEEGHRAIGQEEIPWNEVTSSNESFVKNAEKTYTVVGFLDETSAGDNPNYMSVTLLEHPEDTVTTAFAQLYNKRKAYDVADQFSDSKVNGGLLMYYLVFNEEDFDAEFLRMPLMFVLFLIMTVALFVYIIKNAFALSLTTRIQIIGLLKSAGATHKQVRLCMVFEALMLAVFAIPSGILSGYAADALFIHSTGLGVFYFTWFSVIPTTVLALITVLRSAKKPLKGMRHKTVIEVLRSEKEMLSTHKKSKSFGNITHEMAYNAFYLRRKSYKTSTISFMLVFVLMGFLINILTVNQLKAPETKKSVVNADISFTIKSGMPVETELLNQITALEGIEKSDIYAKTTLTIQEGDVVQKVMLVGMHDTAFNQWMASNGLSSAVYYESEENVYIADKNKAYRSGDEQKIRTQSFIPTPIEVKALYPSLDLAWERYHFSEIMPLSQYGKVVSRFDERDQKKALYTQIDLIADSDSTEVIDRLYTQVEVLLNRVYAKDQFEKVKYYEIAASMKEGQDAVIMAIYGIGLFIMIIGIANIFSSVAMNVQVRQKEFASIRAIGLPMSGVRKLMLYEGLFLATAPVLASIPVNGLIVGLYLKFSKVSFGTFIQHFPVGQWAGVLAIVYGAVLLAYAIGFKKIKYQPLASTLKNTLY